MESERAFKSKFSTKVEKIDFFPDTALISTDIFMPAEEYCRKFYRYEIEWFDGGIDNFANYILSVTDEYPTYIVYLAESGGKRFLTDIDLNIVGEIYDREVLMTEFDTRNVLSRYCTAFDQKKYYRLRDIKITSDLMKQLLKMFEYCAESYGISDIETTAKCIHLDPFLGKTRDEILNMDFAELDMTIRTYNCLSRYGVRTIGEMLRLTDEDFSQVRNLGKKSTKEVKQMQKDVTELLEFCRAQQTTGNLPPQS